MLNVGDSLDAGLPAVGVTSGCRWLVEWAGFTDGHQLSRLCLLLDDCDSR